MADPLTDLTIENVTHNFGAHRAVDDVSLTAAPGELVCLVGPSGCGKTTLLRVAAGLETLQSGRVSIGGEVMAEGRRSVPPEQRNVGLVFQDYALFPHLTVRGNIAFGLQELKGAERDVRVSEALARTGMEGYAVAYPHQLSGGQQQRVALARALAPRPRIVLLDEPFSGLDASLRQRVRDEAAAILRDSGIGALMVTHDPEEAMYMADRIVVMNQGRVRQTGTPDEIYLRPADPFVATFFGDMNRFHGTVAAGVVETPVGSVVTNGAAPGTKVEVLVRPEALSLTDESVWPEGRVRAARYLGRGSLIDVEMGARDGDYVRIHVAGRQLPRAGAMVRVARDDAQTFVFPSTDAK